ncbi:MAG TPA: DUF362 domain-containing protein [Candidatus Hydrogenedentes bacterium]|nr:DUF362 domain-containing protein [Candidatus Hydrogenedentota bacterium]
MDKQTRREFLRRTALTGGVAALAPLDASLAQDAAKEVVAVTPPAPAVQAEAGPVAMGICRWKGAATSTPEDIAAMAKKLTEQAIAALGGMKRFVTRGAVVWIKPNVSFNRTPRQAANTNPDVVATLARLCLEAGAKKVKIGDNTCNEAKLCYRNSGVEAAATAVGAEMVYLDPNRFKEVELKGSRLASWQLYPEIIESDLVINVPVVKDHGLATATLCMKNYMGVIGGDRGEWHEDLATRLCDITAYMKPKLCVIDAVRIQSANKVKQMNLVAAGTDIVALDAVGAEVLGHRPDAVASIVAGQAGGLGQMDYRNKVAFREIDVT